MAYSFTDVQLGVPDLSSVMLLGALGTPGIGNLPSVTTSAQLGDTREGFDATLGRGSFILLAVPVSTAVTPGLLYQWDKNYRVTLVPVKGTSQKTGVPLAAAINTVASNASTVQVTWFQVKGNATVLKTAVAIAPASAIYISGTAGRVYATASAGGQILGARSQNTATVTSTTSSVTVFLNAQSLEGA